MLYVVMSECGTIQLDRSVKLTVFWYQKGLLLGSICLRVLGPICFACVCQTPIHAARVRLVRVYSIRIRLVRVLARRGREPTCAIRVIACYPREERSAELHAFWRPADRVALKPMPDRMCYLLDEDVAFLRVGQNGGSHDENTLSLCVKNIRASRISRELADMRVFAVVFECYMSFAPV